MSKLLDVLKALTLAMYAMVGAAALLLLVQVSSMAKHADAELHANSVAAGAVLDHINRPCKGAAGPDACGTLAQLNKTAIDIGNITIATQEQVSQSGLLIAHSAALLDGIAADVHGEMADAQRATQGVTQATAQASALMEAGKTSVMALQPVLAAAAKTTLDVDALVLNSELPKTLSNVQSLTASGAAIADDARIEADKFAHPNKRKLGFWATADATVLWIHSHVLPPIF